MTTNFISRTGCVHQLCAVETTGGFKQITIVASALHLLAAEGTERVHRFTYDSTFT